MKIKQKVIFTNIIIFICCFILLEAIARIILYEKIEHYNSLKNHHTLKDIKNIILHKQIFPYDYSRFYSYDKSYDRSKPPILFIGCSYTFGMKLDDNNTMPEKIKKRTNRFTYNLGLPGENITPALIYLNDEKILKGISREPEYIIYTYMFDHITRWDYVGYYNIFRKLNLIPQKYNIIFDNMYFSKYIRDMYFEHWIQQDDEKLSKSQDLFFNELKIVKERFQELYPNAKFVVLIYYDIQKNLCDKSYLGEHNEHEELFNKKYNLMLSEEFQNKFKKLGIEVITTEDLIGRKMDNPKDRVENDIGCKHPSSDAWDEIIPPLINKLNL